MNIKDLRKFLTIGNLTKAFSLLKALKGLKGKSKTEIAGEGVNLAELVLGIEVDEGGIEQLIRDAEAWAKEGERIAREGERVLKQVREAIGRVNS